MWIKQFWNKGELVRTLFSVESTNNIKIKIGVVEVTVRVRVTGDGCIWEGISLTNARWVSQSAVHQGSNVIDDVF